MNGLDEQNTGAPDIGLLLKLLVNKKGSDLFMTTGAKPILKIDGHFHSAGSVLVPGQTREIAYSLMNDKQKADFERDLELNLAISLMGIGRFRTNVFVQRGEVSLVVRFVQSRIPSIEELKLPETLKDIVMLKRGLVLVCGATGSGKSTTLASMIDHRNQKTGGHILTIEDPIEFIHKHSLSIVNQREVGFDTHNYHNALINALREAPNVIMIGEIRDQETMQHAINYADTGHLCLSTLHANNAIQALERIINFFPDSAHKQIYSDLAQNLRAVMSQRLLPDVNGKLTVASELMINTPYISELIMEGKTHEIKEVMTRGGAKGMQTFDDALYDLYKEGEINERTAIKHADSRNDLSLKIRMSGSSGLDSGDFSS